MAGVVLKSMIKLKRSDTSPIMEDGELKEFTIKRGKWYTGGAMLGVGDNNVEQGCCLAHYGMACKIPIKNIRDSGVGVLSMLNAYDKIVNWMAKEMKRTSIPASIEEHLAGVNDDDNKTRKYKETEIKRIFKKYRNIKVNFID